MNQCVFDCKELGLYADSAIVYTLIRSVSLYLSHTHTHTHTHTHLSHISLYMSICVARLYRYVGGCNVSFFLFVFLCVCVCVCVCDFFFVGGWKLCMCETTYDGEQVR